MRADLKPLTVPRESLRPPSTDSHGTGLAMSALAHALLVAALAFGVSWRTNEPEGVEAELWAATPQLAAPRSEPAEADPEPPPPPPPPQPRPVPVTPPPKPVVRAPEPVRPPPPPPRAAERDADIATERAEKQRLEKERQRAEDQRARDRREQAERERKAELEKDRLAKLKAAQEAEKLADRKAAEEARKAQAVAQANAQKAAQKAAQQAAQKSAQEQQAQAAQREKMRQDQIRRMQAQLGGTGAPDSSGTAARSAGTSSGYAGRIKARVKPNIVLTDEVSGNPTAEVEVRVAPDGSILSRRIVKASGSSLWDDTVLRAIDRTGILPRDVDGRIPPVMVLAFKPLE